MRIITGLLCAIVVLLIVDLGLPASPTTEAQSPTPLFVYFGQTQGSNMYLDPVTRHVWIMVDLGRVEPIRGVSFSAAGGWGGVSWPLIIDI